VIFRSHPFCILPHFLRLLHPLEREVQYLMHGRKIFLTRHSVIQRRSDLIIPRMRAATVQYTIFCLCWSLKLDTPCTCNYYACHLSGRIDHTVLFANPSTGAVRELEWRYVVIWLHYITFFLTCGLRTVSLYLINLKNLICIDIFKCQVKFYLLPDFLHKIFLTILASTGGPHEIGPRVGQHCHRLFSIIWSTYLGCTPESTPMEMSMAWTDISSCLRCKK